MWERLNPGFDTKPADDDGEAKRHCGENAHWEMRKWVVVETRTRCASFPRVQVARHQECLVISPHQGRRDPWTDTSTTSWQHHHLKLPSQDLQPDQAPLHRHQPSP